MDPSPKSFPILSYVMTRFPTFGPNHSSSSTDVDIEQPPPPPQQQQQPPPPSDSFLSSMPHLSNPKVIASMRRAIADVSQTRSVLRALGPRPDHETVDIARIKLAEIEASLTPQLEEMSLSEDDAGASERRRSAEKEKKVYKAVLELDEMHDAYEKMLKEAEEKLVKIYEKAETGGEKEEDEVVGSEETNEEVVKVLMEANEKDLERIELSNRGLRLLPEAFGKIFGLRVLDLSNNQLQAIPDSISGLQHLQELNVASNLLERLPDSIGVLQNLKILDASSNKLEALPDSISYCKSLLELDVSFNRLTYLPTNIGYELVILQKLNIKLNKICSLPSSIGDMRSLRYLDAHFNQLQGLPLSIGKLTNLEILDLSSNFSDLTELPNTFGDLINLKELNLSNNQIHALPDTFGRLENLTKLNLDQNLLVIPPMEVVNEGVEAVKRFMSKRWLDILEDEDRKTHLEEQEQAQTGWLTRSTSMLKSYVTGISESVSDYLSPRSPIDAYLNQQL